MGGNRAPCFRCLLWLHWNFQIQKQKFYLKMGKLRWDDHNYAASFSTKNIGLAETKQSSGLLLFESIVILSGNAFVSFQGSCCRWVYLEFIWSLSSLMNHTLVLEELVTLISFPEVGEVLCLLFQLKSEFSIRFSILSVCFYFFCLQGYWDYAWFGFSHKWEWLVSQPWNTFFYTCWEEFD